MSISDKPPSATDLLEQWQRAIKERDEAISRTFNNRLNDRMSIEESLSFAHADLRDVMWFLDKTIKLLASKEVPPV